MFTKTIPVLLAAAAIGLCTPAFSQEPGPGTLLISTAALEGTMFEKTVLLVVHHDDDGSIAIMINRPTHLAPTEIFPDLEGAASYTGVLYFGGPVSPTRPYLLTRRTEEIAGAGLRIVDDVYLSGDASLLTELDEAQRSDAFFRIYAGSAQWGPGQLRAEVDAGAWETTIANVGNIFNSAPNELWQRLLEAPHGTDVALLRRPDAPAGPLLAAE